MKIALLLEVLAVMTVTNAVTGRSGGKKTRALSKCKSTKSDVTSNAFSLECPLRTLTVDGVGKEDLAFETLQDALVDAMPGDQIIVETSSIFTSTIPVDKDDIYIRGSSKGSSLEDPKNPAFSDANCPDIILDGCNNLDCGNTIMTVEGQNVVVENFLIRHGSIRFESGATGGVIKGNCIRSKERSTLLVEADDTLFSDNIIFGQNAESVIVNGDKHRHSHNFYMVPDDGAVLNGDHTTVDGNYFHGCNGYCMRVTSNFPTITNNEFRNADDHLEVKGDYAVITNNQFKNAGDYQLNLQGNHFIVTNNRFESGYYPMSLEGDNYTISDNYVDGSIGNGIYLDHDGTIGGSVAQNVIIGATNSNSGIEISQSSNVVIENNHLSFHTRHGITVSGSLNVNLTIRSNEIFYSGTESEEACILINSKATNALIEENQLKYCSYAGIETQADNGSVIQSNIIIEPSTAGILLQRGNGHVVSGNTITASVGEGIAIVDGTGHTITGNIVSGSRTDICLDGSATVTTFSMNTFETGNLGTSCVVAA